MQVLATIIITGDRPANIQRWQTISYPAASAAAATCTPTTVAAAAAAADTAATNAAADIAAAACVDVVAVSDANANIDDGEDDGVDTVASRIMTRS